MLLPLRSLSHSHRKRFCSINLTRISPDALCAPEKRPAPSLHSAPGALAHLPAASPLALRSSPTFIWGFLPTLGFLPGVWGSGLPRCGRGEEAAGLQLTAAGETPLLRARRKSQASLADCSPPLLHGNRPSKRTHVGKPATEAASTVVPPPEPQTSAPGLSLLSPRHPRGAHPKKASKIITAGQRNAPSFPR